MNRVRAVAAGVLGLGLLLAPMAPFAASAGAATVAVQASSFRFCADGSSPCLPITGSDTRTITAGDTVRWIYRDQACDVISPCPGHNVTFDDGVKGATIKKQGADLLSRTFTTAGTYNYVCTVHSAIGMVGVVVVKAAATTTAAPTTTTAPPTVAGSTTRAGSLPATGSRPLPLAAMGAVLVVAGLTLLRAGRRSAQA
jgi:hypothetical protein